MNKAPRSYKCMDGMDEMDLRVRYRAPYGANKCM